MPVYSYVCKKCSKVFDELFLSFSSAESAEREKTIHCPKCESKKVERNSDPNESMKRGAFRKYGLWTYN